MMRITKAGTVMKRPAGRPKGSKRQLAALSASDARVWLRDNGYSDVADLIDAMLERWAKANKATRRNWWDTLAGGKGGRRYTVEGREFPVLASAQRRQGKPVTANAIQRNRTEKPPPVRELARWADHK